MELSATTTSSPGYAASPQSHYRNVQLSPTTPTTPADAPGALLPSPTRRHDDDAKLTPTSTISISIVPDEADALAAPSPEKPQGETKPAPPPAKVLFLDGMRGAACMLVVCHHMHYLEFKKVGAVAVHTFFVLSSFLLTMLLEKKLRGLYSERVFLWKRWLYALTDYFVRRILRVYPFFMAIVLLIACSSDKHKIQWYHVDKIDKFSAWGMLTFAEYNRFFIFWTLPLEIAYYFLIPIFVIVAVVLRRWWWAPMLPLTYWVVYAGLCQYRTAGMGLWTHLPTFVCGSIAAVAYNRVDLWVKKSNFEIKRWHKLIILVIEAVTLVLLVSVWFDAVIFDWFGPYPFKLVLKGREGDHFVCVYIAVLIVCEMLVPGPFSSVFEWSLLRYAGKISFSMYLLHPRIIFSDFMLRQENYYTKFFTMWVLVFFWSSVSYHAIEYPCQWLAQYIGKKIKTLDAKEKAKASQ